MCSQLLDIIIFGASGVTGRRVVSVLGKVLQQKQNIVWGVSGRSQEKLKETLQKCQEEIGTNLNHIPVIIADINNKNSLKEMAKKTRLVINCCGPYRFYGEAVVQACIEEGTHHIDVSGEPHYMEKMQQKYDELARERNVYIVSACGFDCIPIDLGVIFLEKEFNGRLNSVTTYLKTETKTKEKPYANDATWKSLIYGIANGKELTELRKDLFREKLPKGGPKLTQKTLPHKTDRVEGWAIPFIGADRSVVKRTQYKFYTSEKKNPVQIDIYQVVNSFWGLILLYTFGFLNFKLMNYECGRKLLIKYPEFFTNGFFGKDPKDEVLQEIDFSVTLYGEGWKDKNIEDLDKPCDSFICARMKGVDPFYTSASYFAVLSALTLLSEKDKLPPIGGVYTPGYVFAKTSLIDRLMDHGYGYEILQKDKLISKL